MLTAWSYQGGGPTMRPKFVLGAVAGAALIVLRRFIRCLRSLSSFFFAKMNTQQTLSLSEKKKDTHNLKP